MDFYAVLDQVVALLRQRGRASYRALRVQFQLDDEQVEALKEELIEGQRVAVDEGGKVLVWTGGGAPSSVLTNTPAQPPSPLSYTPSHLADRIRAEQAAFEARGSAEGERKTITALFADLKGSTALIEGLDPEEAQAIIDPALQLMMDAVHQYEGYVAKTLGDGILALFGAPLAHEDHPHRALFAALRMQEAMRRYSDTLRVKGYPPLLTRVGLNTGEVVVRSIRTEDLRTDYDPIGHSIHVASRMEQLASPGAIVVSAHTQKLTEGYFAFKDLGPTTIKGIDEPLTIYELQGVGPLRTRLQGSVRRGLARFVGRHREVEQLQRAFESATAGHGQIAGVMGEPGVGKSRLFYEFKLLCQRSCLVLETFSVSHGKAYPYLPLIDLLKHYFQVTTQDDEQLRREKITGKVLTLDRSLEDTLPYLFSLLGLAEPTSPLQHMDGHIRRTRMFDAIKRLLLRESRNQPLLLIFEDLQWLDAETQAFLHVLSESVATARLLLLVNYRPEYHALWHGKTYFSQLRLDPLGKKQAEEMLTALLGDGGADPEVGVQDLGARRGAFLRDLRRFILEKTEGNPFFMEEIVQDLREQGLLTTGTRVRAPLPQDLRVPTTVQGVLTARIDRLAREEKALLQTLAVIGREFSLRLLRSVVLQPEDELHRVLARLQTGEFVYAQPALPEVGYLFKHALTQEVAYNSLLIERRKGLHERTGQAIEEVYRSHLDEHYSELAYHYSRSGNTQKAVDYLQLAGQQAVQQSAYAEAVSHLTLALEVLKTWPEASERARQELSLQLALGTPLQLLKGFGAPEVEAAFTRARALCHHVGETLQLFSALLGLQRLYLARAQFQTAREFSEQLLSLAHHLHEPNLLVWAYNVMGWSLCVDGDLIQAQAYAEQGIMLYDAQQPCTQVIRYGSDARVLCLSLACSALWLLGYPSQALQRSREALAWAQELSHPISMTSALLLTTVLHQRRAEVQTTRERAEALIALATEHGFPLRIAEGTIFRGWALVGQGEGEAGLTLLRQGVMAYRATAAEAFLPSHLARLAEACGKAGQPEEGLTALAEALAVADKTGAHHDEAELYRLKGELTLQQLKMTNEEFTMRNLTSHTHKEAEQCFRKAIAISHKQHAKSWELRASTSLARLWHRQGKKEEARQLLAQIYGWFTEGFDTKDMQEAKAVLAELGEEK